MPDPARPRQAPEKAQSFVAKYEGGERRIDVIELLDVAQAIGADPVKILRALQKSRA